MFNSRVHGKASLNLSLFSPKLGKCCNNSSGYKRKNKLYSRDGSMIYVKRGLSTMCGNRGNRIVFLNTKCDIKTAFN